MLLFFKDRLKGKATFSKRELSLILGVYGDRVKRGEWRDYAIDSLPNMAVFSVFKSAKEKPTYAIAKVPHTKISKPVEYVVYAGEDVLKKSTSLTDALSIFEKEGI